MTSSVDTRAALLPDGVLCDESCHTWVSNDFTWFNIRSTGNHLPRWNPGPYVGFPCTRRVWMHSQTQALADISTATIEKWRSTSSAYQGRAFLLFCFTQKMHISPQREGKEFKWRKKRILELASLLILRNSQHETILSLKLFISKKSQQGSSLVENDKKQKQRNKQKPTKHNCLQRS